MNRQVKFSTKIVVLSLGLIVCFSALIAWMYPLFQEGLRESKFVRTKMLAQIAAASGEQSQGIEQINTAVGEMEKVTQQNAANAEESAAASEELSAQAEQMQGVVAELAVLVAGAGKKPGASSRPDPEPRRRAAGPKRVHAAALKKDKPRTPAAGRSTEKPAEQMIPLGDEQFADF